MSYKWVLFAPEKRIKLKWNKWEIRGSNYRALRETTASYCTRVALEKRCLVLGGFCKKFETKKNEPPWWNTFFLGLLVYE